MMDTSQVSKNLFTNEDPFHVHKTLGFLAIASFFTRMMYTGVADMGFEKFPAWTPVAVMLHMSLSLSSLVFKIPSRRINEGNRIWPQFRYHSICFTARHSAIILLYWAEKHVLHIEHQYWANYAIVFLTLLGVDAANASVQSRSNSVRDLEAHPAAKYFFSNLQFGATANTLLGLRRSSTHYYIIFVMQMTAFAATLRRKNVIVSSTGRRSMIVGYGILLCIGLFLAIVEFSRFADSHSLNLFMIVARAAFLIRVGGPHWFGILKSRYIVWAVAAAFLHVTRPFGPNPHPIGVWLAEESQRQMIALVNAALVIISVWYGYVVTKRQLNEQKTIKNTDASSKVD